jgi:hypothetical protein
MRSELATAICCIKPALVSSVEPRGASATGATRAGETLLPRAQEITEPLTAAESEMQQLTGLMRRYRTISVLSRIRRAVIPFGRRRAREPGVPVTPLVCGGMRRRDEFAGDEPGVPRDLVDDWPPVADA